MSVRLTEKEAQQLPLIKPKEGITNIPEGFIEGTTKSSILRGYTIIFDNEAHEVIRTDGYSIVVLKLGNVMAPEIYRVRKRDVYYLPMKRFKKDDVMESFKERGEKKSFEKKSSRKVKYTKHINKPLHNYLEKRFDIRVTKGRSINGSYAPDYVTDRRSTRIIATDPDLSGWLLLRQDRHGDSGVYFFYNVNTIETEDFVRHEDKKIRWPVEV